MAGIGCFPTTLNQDKVSVNTIHFFLNQMRHLHSALALPSQPAKPSSGRRVSQRLVPLLQS